MLKKNLKAILTIALLGLVLGGFPSCHKDNKEPVSKIPQLAGTHWKGTITFNDSLLGSSAFDYSMLFFLAQREKLLFQSFNRMKRILKGPLFRLNIQSTLRVLRLSPSQLEVTRGIPIALGNVSVERGS